jgi:hypothetical protein
LISDSNSSTGSDSQVTARKVGESMTSALDAVATAINYPLGIVLISLYRINLCFMLYTCS